MTMEHIMWLHELALKGTSAPISCGGLLQLYWYAHYKPSLDRQQSERMNISRSHTSTLHVKEISQSIPYKLLAPLQWNYTINIRWFQSSDQCKLIWPCYLSGIFIYSPLFPNMAKLCMWWSLLSCILEVFIPCIVEYKIRPQK